MQWALGDIIKRKTHKNTTTCIIFWYGIGLKLQACMQQCWLLRQVNKWQDYWYRCRYSNKYRPTPIPTVTGKYRPIPDTRYRYRSNPTDRLKMIWHPEQCFQVDAGLNFTEVIIWGQDSAQTVIPLMLPLSVVLVQVLVLYLSGPTSLQFCLKIFLDRIRSICGMCSVVFVYFI